MSIEHDSTNTQPLNQELLQNPEVQAAHAHEETIALGGIRQAITQFRLARAETKLKKLESTDHVIKHAPVESKNLRGFGSPPIRPEDKPLNFVQRRAFKHRVNQVEKRRKNQRERYRLEQVYGKPAPRAKTWNPVAGKLEKVDRGTVASFNLDKRMSGKEFRTERKAQERYRAAGGRIDRIDQRLDKGERGDTLYGKIRKRRIGKQAEKVERLQAKLSGEPYDPSRTEKLLESSKEVGKRLTKTTAKGAKFAARKGYEGTRILARQTRLGIDRGVEITKAYAAHTAESYRKGLSGEEANDGRMQRRINKAARASGRKVSETRQKKRGKGGFVLRERDRRSSTNTKEATLPRNASDKRQRATRSVSRQPLVLEGRLPDGRYWYVPAPTSQARRS